MSYQKIKFKIQYLEQRIKNELIRSKKDKDLSLKYLNLKGIILPKFRLFFLNLGLLFWNIVFNIARFYFILFKDPALSFNLFFNQKNLEVCDYSYYEFKIIQKKARVFSLAGLTTLVLGIVIVSLILNLATGPIQQSYAATYNWVQNDWTTLSADTAIHTSNQSDWVKYSAKDANLSTGTDLSLSATSSSQTQTSDSDFNEGTLSHTVVSGNSVSLMECGGWMYDGHCWYDAGGYSTSCDTVCASHGGCETGVTDYSNCAICQHWRGAGSCLTSSYGPTWSLTYSNCRYNLGTIPCGSSSPNFWRYCPCNN